MQRLNQFPAVVFMVLSLPATVQGDVVTDWNEALLRAIQNETTHPCLASRNLAMLHIAIFDAVNAITKTHRTYCFKTEIQSCVEPQHSKVSQPTAYGVRQLDTAFPSARSGAFPSFSSSEIQSCVQPQHSTYRVRDVVALQADVLFDPNGITFGGLATR